MRGKARDMAIAICLATAVGGGLAYGVIHLLTTYGWTLFVATPLLIGFAASAFLALRRPYDLATSIAAAAVSGATVCLAFLAIGIEGLICVVMAAPLVAPLAVLGGMLGHAVFHARRLPRPGETTMLVALLVAGAAIVEARLPRVPDINLVEDSMIIPATTAETWRTIVGLSDVAPAHDVLFRAGLACPQRTKIVDPRVGGKRVCTLSTGVLMEQIDHWEPGRRLSWRALSTPAPMRELNPFHPVDAPHLHGFYRNVRGEFALEPAGAHATRLIRRTWYTHDLAPAAYWTFWCNFAGSRVQRFVLDEVRRQAKYADVAPAGEEPRNPRNRGTGT